MDDQTTRELRKETQPVMFAEWEAQLVSLGLDEAQTEAMRRSIVGLLARCKAQRAPVSIAIARQHLEEKGPGIIRREALRWFVTAGRYRPNVAQMARSSMEPPSDAALPPPLAAELAVSPASQKQALNARAFWSG
jgi:hypothetical protein